MDNTTFIIIAVAVASVFYYFINRKLEQQRTTDLKRIAGNIGLNFQEKGSRLLIPRYNEFNLFTAGYDRKIINQLYGDTRGGEPVIFGYKYTTGHGKHSNTVTLTAAYINSSQQLPLFEVFPEGFTNKLGKLFGQRDIDFTHRPVFSRRFILRGPDNAGDIPRLFSETVTAYFEKNPDLCVQSNGHGLLIHLNGKRIEPSRIMDFYQQIKTLQQLFEDSARNMPPTPDIRAESYAEARSGWSDQPKPLWQKLLFVAVAGIIAFAWFTTPEQASNQQSENKQSVYVSKRPLLNKGWDFHSKGDYLNAIKRYSEYIAAYSGDKRGYYYRGLSYEKQGDNDRAEADFRRAIEIDKNYIEAYIYIDFVLAKDQRFYEIIEMWDQFIELNPKNPRALLERGGARFHSGDTEAALEDAKASCELGNNKACSIHKRYSRQTP